VKREILAIPAARAVYTRRSVLAASVYLISATACTSWRTGSYEGLRSDRWLGPARTIAVLEGERAFAEGPAVAPDGDVFFTNLRHNRIMRYSPATGALSVFRENSNGANGQKFDAHGRLTVCEAALGRITRTDLANGDFVVLCDSYGGAPIEDVNDLAMDARGRIYFSSRPKNLDPARGNVSAVYRLDTSGTVRRVLARPDVQMPNGLAVSTDQSTLYVIDSNGQAGGRRVLEAYTIAPDGELAHRRLLHDFSPGRGGDGMCVDRRGNLYVAAGLHAIRNSTAETLDVLPGIHVFSPHGRLLAYRETPEDAVTNCAFGRGASAHTLYVTCGRQLLAMEATTPGPEGVRP
jgi:gluconolactonase